MDTFWKREYICIINLRKKGLLSVSESYQQVLYRFTSRSKVGVSALGLICFLETIFIGNYIEQSIVFNLLIFQSELFSEIVMMLIECFSFVMGIIFSRFESGGQTREHALLVRSLGVNQLCVAVNKLDTVSWSEDRFKEVVGKMQSFLKQAGFRDSDVTYVPCSGLTGENLTAPPTCQELSSWYSGPCLLDVIDRFKCPERPVAKPFRLSINDIFKGTGSGFCVSGKVETGMVQQGDKLLVQPLNETATVKALSIDDMPVQSAFAGDYVNVTISNIDQQNLAVGNILSDPLQPAPVTCKLEARIVIFNITVPITSGFPVVLHQQSLVEPAVIVKLVAQLHKSSGEVMKRRPRCLLRNTTALVVIETSRPVCVELYRNIKELGRLMLRSAGTTIAAGLVTKIL